ncbi:MAG: dihydroorotate dehydrogenase electron transfer subunit [Candidatus Omnitrophota bacterium]
MNKQNRISSLRCSRIVSNKEIAPGHYRMAIMAPEIARHARPGQFVHVRCDAGRETLLRRPFSIHRIGSRFSVRGSRAHTENRKPNTIEILYKVIGKGTEILSQRKLGEKLDIIGPLGNGFAISPKSLNPILVAGGIGAAPLLFLAEKLVRLSVSGSRLVVIIGARTKKLLLCEDEFKKLGVEVIVATEDGSKGKKGLASEVLLELLRTPNTEHRTPNLYGCGPRPMLKELAKIAKQYKIPSQVSLEERMACGLGACMGCVVKTRFSVSGSRLSAHTLPCPGLLPAGRRQQGANRTPYTEYKRVCSDGPVFDADEVVW